MRPEDTVQRIHATIFILRLVPVKTITRSAERAVGAARLARRRHQLANFGYFAALRLG
jgi:hypothetical protein